MTGFLASVRSLDEARRVLDAGADFIDLKDPATGALGALAAETQTAIVRFVAGRRTVSATVGDPTEDLTALVRAVRETAARGIDIVKIGFGSSNARLVDYIAELGRQCAQDIALVAVLFADRRPRPDLLSTIADAGFTGVMLDTADKRSGRLRELRSDAALAQFVCRGRSLGLLTGLAGSLQLADIRRLLDLEPDYLGFRGALCHGTQRDASLDPLALRRVRKQIPVQTYKGSKHGLERAQRGRNV